MAPSIQYAFEQTGLDDIKDKIVQLHNELRNGEITYQQYNTQIREATSQGRAATQEFNQMKGAIAATNPELLEYTRTMSQFGAVASVVLSVTNAINLAQMASMGINQTVEQDLTNQASLWNQYVKDLASFGPASEITKTAYEAWQAQMNKTAYDQHQLALQTVQNGATMFASVVAVAGGISQSYLGISAAIKLLTSDATLLENLGVAFTAMGNAAFFAMTSIVAPIALAIAALYGLEYVMQKLEPEFGGYMGALQSSIEKSWNVDSLEAYLISPFVGAYVDMVGIGSNFIQFWTGVYDGIISGFVNPLINAFDAMGGHLSQITLAPIPTTPSTADVLKGIGISAPSLSGVAAGQDALSQNATGNPFLSAASSPSNSTNVLPPLDLTPNTLSTLTEPDSTTIQQLEQMIQTGGTTSQILQQQEAAGASLTAANSNLVTINTSIGTMSNAITASQQAQQAAVNSALQAIQQQSTTLSSQITELQQQAATLATQPQTKQIQTQELANTTDEQPYYVNTTETVASDAANQLEQVNQEISQLQSQQASLTSQAQAVVANAAASGVLDVSSSGAQAVISSMGLNSGAGIGSIIAGALGNGSGSGTYAGINATQLQQFANTGDYGVFSQAVLQDNASLASQTTPTNEYNSLVSSYESMGFSASQSAIYANAVKENSNNFNGAIPTAGNNGGYGSGIGSAMDTSQSQDYGGDSEFFASATGFEGTTTGPTTFLAGEAGPEKVSIQPLNGSGSGSGPNVNVYVTVQGSLLSENDLANTIDGVIKTNLLKVGY